MLAIAKPVLFKSIHGKNRGMWICSLPMDLRLVQKPTKGIHPTINGAYEDWLHKTGARVITRGA